MIRWLLSIFSHVTQQPKDSRKRILWFTELFVERKVEESRNRPLAGTVYPALWVDALYEKVQVDGRIVSMTVLIYSCLCAAEREEILHWDTQENLAGAYGWVRQKVCIWCDRLLCQALSESGSVSWRRIGIFSGFLYFQCWMREKSHVRLVTAYRMEYAEDCSVSRAYISHESFAATLTTVA